MGLDKPGDPPCSSTAGLLFSLARNLSRATSAGVGTAKRGESAGDF